MFAVTPAMALTLALVSGCAASYDTRMAFLDRMSSSGIKYRGQLQQQGTDPSDKACGIGYDLLKPNIPNDEDGNISIEWTNQVREAYVKACLTGKPRPKPDPSGIKAVSPVPFSSSETPAAPGAVTATP
jgi:hypothetical protein